MMAKEESCQRHLLVPYMLAMILNSPVGNFSSASFGTASYVRRGDGKQGYLAGLQNYSNII